MRERKREHKRSTTINTQARARQQHRAEASANFFSPFDPKFAVAAVRQAKATLVHMSDQAAMKKRGRSRSEP